MNKYDSIATTKELADRQNELENIQHITDVYMAGFVLMDTKVDTKDKTKTTLASYISRLAVKTDPKALKSFRKGFAIAALFHDMAILPKCETEALQTEGSQTALDFLIKHSIFKEEEKQQLSGWADKKKKHALISAYSTLQCIEQQNELYADLDDFQIGQKEILQPAIRAIVYHVCSPINPGIGKLDEPILTFLYLLDEIYTWEPSFVYDPLPLKASLTDEKFNLPPIQTYYHSTFQKISFEVSKKESFPLFNFGPSLEPDNNHKDCTAILQLAQTFGLLKDGGKEGDNQRWQPRARIYIAKDSPPEADDEHSALNPALEAILTTLDKAATAIDNEASPLIHQWLARVKKEQHETLKEDYLLVGAIKNPFANVDIRDHFKAIEAFIIKHYQLQ